MTRVLCLIVVSKLTFRFRCFTLSLYTKSMDKDRDEREYWSHEFKTVGSLDFHSVQVILVQLSSACCVLLALIGEPVLFQKLAVSISEETARI